MDDPIEAQVVAILSDRELALNRGMADGVEIGMRFTVLGTVPVQDLEDDEVFNISVPKVQVKIVRTDGPHVSIGRTFRTIKGTPPLSIQTLTEAASGLAALRGTPDSVERINAAPGEVVAYDKAVRRGDRAVQEIHDA